ncbi:unnamed protein product [Prunus armeniaca]
MVTRGASLTITGGTSSSSSTSERTRRTLFLGRSNTAVSTATLSAGEASTAAASVLEASRSLLRPGATCTEREAK